MISPHPSMDSLQLPGKHPMQHFFHVSFPLPFFPFLYPSLLTPPPPNSDVDERKGPATAGRSAQPARWLVAVAKPSRMRAVQHGGHRQNGPPVTINIQPGPTQFVGRSLFAALSFLRADLRSPLCARRGAARTMFGGNPTNADG